MLWSGPESRPVVILVVDSDDDHELSTVLARGNEVGERYSGEWGSGQSDGGWLVGFRLFRPSSGFERVLTTDAVHRELVEAILDVPHLVAIVPQAMAGETGTPAAIGARLDDSLVIEVEQRSAHVARLLAPHRNN